MRKLLLFIFILSCIVGTAQTIQERELDLQSYKADEGWGKKKDKALELLSLDKFNIVAIDYLLQLFDQANQKDSITLFLDNLIASNESSPIPYLIRVQLSKYESLNSSAKIGYLKKAYKIDSSNIQVNYILAKQYYDLFHKGFTKNGKKENLEYYARNSILYLKNLCLLNSKYKESMKYPVIQLSSYLNDVKSVSTFKGDKTQASYFPIFAFTGLPSNWQTDYSIDVINGIETAIFHLNWYSEHLSALDEPVLSDSLNTKIFRFTWLRSFDHPVVIRIENTGDTISLFWKVSDGEGGYSAGKVFINERKALTVAQWNTINTKINAIGFWDLPTTENTILGTDGAQWILEGKRLGKYHVVDRWSGGEISSVCMDLLKMTDLDIKKDDIY
jgi:hypothetical protein